MKKYLLLLILLTYMSFLKAQQEVIVYSSLTQTQLIGKQIAFLEDEEGKLTIEDIQKESYQNKFQKNNTDVFAQPPSKTVIWVKTTIQNQTKEDLWIEIGRSFSCWKIDFYRPNENGVYTNPVLTGSLRPYKNREYPTNFFWLKLATANTTIAQTFYIRLESEVPKTFPLKIGTLLTLSQDKYWNDNITAGFAGLALVMTFYNLFLLFATRDKIYFLYTLYVVTVSLGLFFINGYPIFLNQFWWTYNIFCVGVLAFPVSLFAIYYLKLRETSPFMYKVIIVLSCIGYIILPLLNLVIDSVVIGMPFQLTMALISCTIIGTSAYLWYKGNQKARFYTIGWSFFTIGTIIYILSSNGVISYTLFTSNAMYFGYSFEIVLFSFALADKLNTERKEKELAQEKNIELISQQKQLLETKVKERTEDLQNANEELQSSEEELKQNLEELQTTQDNLNSVNQELSSNFSILENKNQIIAQKNKDITSSINYAKRIQDAMLTKSRTVSEIMANSFIYFQPRDIVSGDFYYFNNKNGKIIIAAVDCTGHGVPGAFMSLIGNNLLNQIIDNQKIQDPAQILTALDKLVTEVLDQSHSTMRDGMDIAICVLDIKNNMLEYAGAKNPLVYIQNQELKIIKADRNSVGGNFGNKHQTTFTTSTLYITEPTCFYIYSDGYQDQFGGKDDKKYTTKRFLQTLQESSTQEYALQSKFLDKQFKNWKGKNKRQLDDVLVIGFEMIPN